LDFSVSHLRILIGAQLVQKKNEKREMGNNISSLLALLPVFINEIFSNRFFLIFSIFVSLFFVGSKSKFLSGPKERKTERKRER